MPREFSRPWEEYAEHLCFVTETYFVPRQDPSLLPGNQPPISVIMGPQDHNVAQSAQGNWQSTADDSVVERIGMVIHRIVSFGQGTGDPTVEGQVAVDGKQRRGAVKIGVHIFLFL